MNISRVFAATAIAAAFSLSSAQAQTLKAGLVPAEFPPSSYQGRQYVDSEGCVFIRAGIDGNVTWVPRVTRNRKVICGFQPTFARKAAPQAVTAAANPAPTKRVAKVKKQPTKKVQIAAPQPVIPANQGRQAACRGANAVSQQYVGRVGEDVRCGPQQGTFTTRVRRDNDRGAAVNVYRQARTEPVRVVPRHVYEQQQVNGPAIKVPKGYKPAWDDDRLNPKRAHQTLAGKARMDQIWSDTLPRKLIARDAGQALTAQNSSEYVSVGSGSSTMTLSTRSTSVKAPRKASHRYVQAGLFQSDASARAAAKRIAKTGLPVRMGKIVYKGTSYPAVFAGPFQTQAQLDRAFAHVQAAGYRNARLRK